MTSKKASNGRQLLWLVGLAFAVQIAAITWLIMFAQEHKPKEVPLATAPSKAAAPAPEPSR